MSRYIDADGLIADMQERYCKPCKERKEDYNEVRCRACWVDDAMDEVDGFGDNGIDIVRCKECRWLDKGENESCSWSMCTRHIGQYINVDDEAYCSYGEREGE